MVLEGNATIEEHRHHHGEYRKASSFGVPGSPALHPRRILGTYANLPWLAQSLIFQIIFPILQHLNNVPLMLGKVGETA